MACIKVALILTLLNLVQADISLTILHTNDVHARIEQADDSGGQCSESEAIAGECWGGFARIITKVREVRNRDENVIFLDGGDQFQGTLWYSVHKWTVVAYFMNMAGYDVMALGNHEFDDGIAGVVPFLGNVSFPVISSNIDAKDEPAMEGRFDKSAVLVLDSGLKVGIVGYTTTYTPSISEPEKLTFDDEIESIRAEVAQLQNDPAVKIIIALGHAGFSKDKEIAQYVEGVDVVVGGHTNTFLWPQDEAPPSTEVPEGDYPFIVRNDFTHKDVPVVQAFTRGKYLGELRLVFNDNGDVINWEGSPIPLDKNIEEDPDVLKELEPWRDEIIEANSREIAHTNVLLDGNRKNCRLQECNLGNFVTDATVDINIRYEKGDEWNKVAIGVWNGGGIRASIDEKEEDGLITFGDVLTSFPFANTIELIDVTGSELNKMMEHSVSGYSPVDTPGRFLQISGMKVVYDVTKPVGQRVVDLQAMCTRCRYPIFEPVVSENIYRVVMPTFLIDGGDGFDIYYTNRIETGDMDADVIERYMKKMSPITIGLEGRISFVNGTLNECSLSDRLRFKNRRKSKTPGCY